MEREDRLFDVYERTDASWRKDDEPPFRFWNRSAWEPAEWARGLAEDAFALYPLGERRHLRRRFRQEKGNDHEGALWELLLFALLDPRTVTVRADTPDFEFRRNGQLYSLEATAFDQHMSSDKLEQTVLATIEKKLSSPDYFVHISSRGELKTTPPHAAYLRPIGELLKTPPTTESADLVEVNLDAYAEGMYRLTVSLLPKSRDSDGHRLRGIWGSEWIAALPAEIEWATRLLRALGRKAKKLKGGHASSYLAVSVPCDPSVPIGDVAIRALYGHSEEAGESGLDSLWQNHGKPRNLHILGVVVCGTLVPTALDSSGLSCRLFVAPDAPEPPEPLSRLPRVWLEDGEVRGQSGERLATLVGDGLGASV